MLLGALAVFAWLRARCEPVLAAAIVAGLLGSELGGAVVVIGVPDLPAVLQVTFVVLVYGGLGFLLVAAVCATRHLHLTARGSPRAPRPAELGWCPLCGAGPHEPGGAMVNLP